MFWEAFRRESYHMRGILWALAIGMCAAALFFGMFLGGGYRIVFALASILSLAWALWATYYRP